MLKDVNGSDFKGVAKFAYRVGIPCVSAETDSYCVQEETDYFVGVPNLYYEETFSNLDLSEPFCYAPEGVAEQPNIETRSSVLSLYNIRMDTYTDSGFTGTLTTSLIDDLNIVADGDGQGSV